LRHFQAGVGRITATVVKEVTDVVGLEYFDKALVLGAVFLQAFQFVAAGTERARGCGQEAGNRRFALLAGVDEILAQGADDAIAASVDLTDPGAVLSGCLDDSAGGGIDHGRHTAGLGVKGVFLRHCCAFLAIDGRPGRPLDKGRSSLVSSRRP
jgi:hypothetical protein